MIISLIAALDRKRVIGREGAIPWHLSDDLKNFKRVTMGKPLIMGRKTWDAIGGKALKGRTNIVMTRSNLRPENVLVSPSVEHAIALCKETHEVMVIGGEEIFRQFMPMSKKMYLTLVHADVGGDTYFPEFNWLDWRHSFCEVVEAGGANDYTFSFVVLDRLDATM